MLGHVDLETIADPFSASGDQQIVDLFDRAAEGIVFRTAQTDGAELHLGKIRLLLSDLFQQRLKVIRQLAGAVRGRDHQPAAIQLRRSLHATAALSAAH